MSESTGKWLTGDEFEIWGDYYLLAQMRACDEGNKRSHTWLAGIQVNRFGICRSARTFSRNVRSGRQLPRFWNYKFIVLNDFRSKVVPSKNISQRKNLDSWQMSEKTKGYLLAQQDALLWAGDQLAELSQLQVS